ncbi:glycosyltransferase [Pseudomonas sp. GWSMS-1]|uniref:glycosyltransferase n=1 Tax=Pseudomonas sp. GWSMS-1 TaxID=3308997 RepID=UPI003CF1833C
MMQSDVMVGGRCLGKPWRVGIAGIAYDNPEQLFVLNDSSWESLRRELPLPQLRAYCDAHGLIIERVVTEHKASYDALLLVSDAHGGVPLVTSNLQARRYLLLRGQQSRFSAEQEASFARIFLPLGEPFTDGRLVCLNPPLNLPATPASVPLWRICADTPELPGLLSLQWRECLESGNVPVYVGDWSVPAWLPPGSYIDARDCDDDDREAYCNEQVAAAAAVLASYCIDKRSYPYSAECWVAALTAAIAGDAASVRENRPLLSVIIPAYNYGRFLKQTISSVLDQGYDDIEILVLDNASTDGTPEVVASFAKESCVRYLRNSRNVGPSYNVLNGIQIAQGRYLSILMADDYYNPGYLSRLLPRLQQKPKAVVGYTSIRWVNEQGQALVAPRHPGYRSEDYDGGRNEVAELLIHDNYIPPSAALIQREPFLQVWRRDPQLNGAGDWLSMLQVAEKYPDFIFLSEPGVTYRSHAAQLSTEFYSSSAPLADHIRLVEGVFERNAEGKLRGRELDVAAHLRRRLALYPSEVGSPLGVRVRNLCERLEALAALGESSLLSIILTTYNRPGLLKDALASVGCQTLRDFEVILINDNGEPVEHLLAAYDFPITYIRQGRNQGLSAARNAGLALARGRYIVYLDDDDIYLPNHLAVLAEAFEQHPGSVIYTGVEYVNEKLENGQRLELGRGQPFKHEVFDRDRLFVQNYIPVNTWAHPRQMLATVGEFDTSLAAFEDWDMLLRLATRYPFVHVPVVTSEVHTREQSTSDDHMLGRERKNFPALYQLLYQRYPGSDSEVLKRERGDMLQRLGISVDECADVPTLQRWLAERLPTEPENRLINQYLQEHDGGPMIGIIVLDIDGQSPLLMQTLKSLIGERCLYATLKIVVLTSGGDVPKTSAGEKLHFVRLSDEHLASQINRVVNENDFSWFMLARAGDEFTPSGLMVAGLELAANPECRAIYGDQLQRLPDGSLGGAFLPSFNLDLLLSFPLIMARHWLFRRDVFLGVGSFDAQFAEALEFDLLVRLIEAQGLLGLGHVDEPLLIIDAPALQDNPDERRVIERHLAQRGYQARVLPGLPARYRIDYGHSSTPLVSIIIAVDAPLASLQRCLDSLLEKTLYAHYEILLGAHDGLDADTQAWLQGIASLANARLRVVSAGDIMLAQNQAAMAAQGEYLLLLSGESVAVSEAWLNELLNHAQRPEVGVVGGKLLSGDGRIDQAGLLLGLRGPAGRAFAGEAMDSAGYLQRLQVDQNYSAVSDACLMVRTDIFRQLGGLDVTLSAYRDIDFCLRVRAAGYLTVWAAHAVLMHEHVYREPDVGEQDALYERHLPDIARDPAYNRNLALSGRGFDLEIDSGLTWRPLSWRPLPVVLAHPADPFGCGNYRVIKPFSALKESGMADGMMSIGLLQVPDVERFDPDIIVLQRQIGDERLDAMRRIKKFSRAFTIYELDDYLPNLPLKSVHRAQMPKDILKSLRKGLSFVDRFTVSTAPLAEAFAGLHSDIRVIENRLPVDWWSGLSSKRQRGRKPRVGWAGGVSHTGDLELIADVVKALAGEVEWVFMGMCPEIIRPYVHEMHAGVAIDLYPAALARLDLDLALAPVEQNLFNECKSNLRLLEYGACGFPVVCSDLVCYQGVLPVTRVKNRFKDWVDAIRMHISDLDASAKMGDELRKHVQESWMLEGVNLEAWRASWLPD